MEFGFAVSLPEKPWALISLTAKKTAPPIVIATACHHTALQNRANLQSNHMHMTAYKYPLQFIMQGKGTQTQTQGGHKCREVTV